MRNKTVSLIMLSLLNMLALTLIPPIRAPPPSQIYIGVAQSYTGINAAGCMMHQLYYDMIIEDYNALGGLYVPEYDTRINITLVPYDDHSSIEDCLTGIEYLITTVGVDLMFAPWSTEFNVAAFEKFETHKMPVIGLTVGSDDAAARMKAGEITYSFVVLGQPYEDAIEVVDLFNYINTQTTEPISKVGILYRSDLHGTEHSAAIGDALTAAGFTVVKFDYPIDIVTFVPLIGDLQAADVDVAMVTGYGEAATFVYECMALDYNPKMVFHGPMLETPLLVYAVFGFTPGQMCGLSFYDGFPSTAYKTPKLRAWAEAHRVRTGFYPFPSAGPAFYTGIECLFKAVETVGLSDKTAIRDALATTTWNETLMGQARLRIGQSIEVEGCGTLTQWQGGQMMDVIWPQCTTSTDFIIYPKFPWNYPTHLDLNKDRAVDGWDITDAIMAYGAYPDHARWYEKADINEDNLVNIVDVGTISKGFGKTAAFGGTIPAPPHP